MITPVSYNGPYVPYAKTNRELTEIADDVKGSFVWDNTMSVVYVTGDGTKTFKTLFTELISAFMDKVSAMGDDDRIRVSAMNIEYAPGINNGIRILTGDDATRDAFMNTNTTFSRNFKTTTIVSNKLWAYMLNLSSTASSMSFNVADVTSGTITSYLETACPNNKKIYLHYQIYHKV